MSSEESASESPSVSYAYPDPPWWAPEPPTDLIFDDGEPLESNRHRIAMNTLIEVIEHALRDRTDVFVGGNMFLYYSQTQAMNREFRGPDVFVALGVDGSRERLGWVSWQEGGKYPDVIIELSSPTTARIDRGEKKQLYEQTLRIPYYFIYDPFDPGSLEGWRLDPTQGYQSLQPNDRGWLWCDVLGHWFGVWQGVISREPATGTCGWLRLFDLEGELVPLYRETAEQERQRAEDLAQRLRELGIDPDELIGFNS